MVDQPAIQHVVEEAVRAGLTDLLMMAGRQKRALEDHFDREPSRGGEIQLTDALQTLAVSGGEGGGVYGVVFQGRRYDTGDKLSYLKAVISIASERVEFGEGLKAW